MEKLKINAFDIMLQDGKNPVNVGIVLGAYERGVERGDTLLHLDGDILGSDVEQIAATCKEYRITEFVISGIHAGLFYVLAAFEEYGFYVDGMRTTKGWSDDIPAIHLSYKSK